MTYTRRFSCKKCGSRKTQRKGSRNGLKRFFCTACDTWFSINHKQKNTLWVHYVEESSLRSLGRKEGKTFTYIDKIVTREMNALPENGYLTKTYMSHLHYRGVLCIDGTWIKVKGEKGMIPYIYAMDYHTHDIICGFLCMSESREAFTKLFHILHEIGYPLTYVVMDDVLDKARIPLEYYFPRVQIQLCTTHFLRSAVEFLKEANKNTGIEYVSFLKDVKTFLGTRTTMKNKMKSFTYLYQTYGADSYCEALVQRMIRKKDFLLLFCKVDEDVPATNNLIEGNNTQIKDRIKRMRGFHSFESASRFLNAWLIRRRTLPFTSCSKKFKHLNGQTSLGYALEDEKIFKKICKDIYGK